MSYGGDSAMVVLWKLRCENWYLQDGSQFDNKGVSKITRIKLQYYHLVAMRRHRGLDREQFAEYSGIHFDAVRYFETTKDKDIPNIIIEIYLMTLKITKLDFKKIKDIFNGTRTSMDEEKNRIIPRVIVDEVRERDKNECTVCGVKDHLNFHHIKRYDQGGLHTVENLKLLCVSCHAEEHKGERGYGLLKSRAEKLLGGTADERTESK